MGFHLGSLALSRFLDVFGRQPSNGGRVLMVRPELTGVMLAVQSYPQTPVQTVVVEMVLSNEMSAKPKTTVINFNGILDNVTKKKTVHT